MSSKSNDTTPMDKVAVAEYLNCSVPQIIKLVARGDIPEGQYIGGRKKYWFKVHLDQYKAAMFAKAAASWNQPRPVKASTPKLKAVPTPTPVPSPTVSTRSKRELQDRDDSSRRQRQHIAESRDDGLDSDQAAHLKSIMMDLSDLLRSRKAGG